MTQIKVGIIGGTGLDNPDLLTQRQEKYVTTPFGKPSDALITGRIGGVECVLLGRHGRQHSVSPSGVNYRANLYALRAEGCTHVLATTACGSLKEDFRPGQIVLVDQFIDMTKKRIQTFYDGTSDEFSGICHIPMALPFCCKTREVVLSSLQELGLAHQPRGTMVVIEGPRFSSKAESNLFHSWGADLINMTLVPEVVLARELGLCYASLALVTDYDCWKDSKDEQVSVEAVMKMMKQNSKNALSVLAHVIPRLAETDWTDVIHFRKTEAAGAVMNGH